MPELARVALWILITLSWTSTVAAQTLTANRGYVTDLADILDDSAEANVDARVRQAEARSGAEIAVATVPSLEGASIDDYANRLFTLWGIGKKGSDNGVLILVAPTERKIRIEVGYGLEPILPDGLAGEIIRTAAIPAFKNDDFPGGVLASVNRVAGIVEAGHVVTAEERRQYAANAQERAPTWVTTPFFGLFIAIGAACLGLGLRAKAGFFVLFGSLFGGMPFGMALIPVFNATLWILIPLAVAMFVFGWRKGGDSWRDLARGLSGAGSSAGSRGRSSGWVMGGSSSSRDSSSSSSSSSSGSFGGGSSGGGGASGSW